MKKQIISILMLFSAIGASASEGSDSGYSQFEVSNSDAVLDQVDVTSESDYSNGDLTVDRAPAVDYGTYESRLGEYEQDQN